MNTQPVRSQLDVFATGFTNLMLTCRWLVIVAAIAAAGFIAKNAQDLAFDNNYRAFFSEQNPEAARL